MATAGSEPRANPTVMLSHPGRHAARGRNGVPDQDSDAMTRSRLLIVHPEPSALAMLAAMLGPLGHDLIAATCDRVALQILAGRPGLVLIGVDPAEPGARDLLTRFRREYPATPVIVLLTRIPPGWEHQALLLGATMVLKFPLPANQLQAAVIQALDDATFARHGNRHEPERPVGEPPVQP